MSEYGFTWDQVTVERMAEYGDHKCLRIKTEANSSIDIHVSPMGKSIRVFKNGKELK